VRLAAARRSERGLRAHRAREGPARAPRRVPPGGFRYIERALVNRDVDLVQALVVEATLFIVLANFLADAIHAWLDPRIRTGDPL
jgi:hypothetical protein